MERTFKKVRPEIHKVIAEKKGRELLQAICDILEEKIPHYPWVGIYMLRNGKLHLDAWAGKEETEHKVIDVGQGICGLATRIKNTVIVDDVSKDNRYLACFPDTKSEIVVPICRNEEVIGEIDIDGFQTHAFGQLDRNFLEWVAEKIGEKY